ncbi:alpha-(1,3)-fucosyltransferase C-like [Ornithodoros turicata]|uniref:alpha-(1,3)-fucosyltransferase C-like n=1 Tax=Ornithodoros turicata TaxID=34597 RepID=UPI00313A3580
MRTWFSCGWRRLVQCFLLLISAFVVYSIFWCQECYEATSSWFNHHAVDDATVPPEKTVLKVLMWHTLGHNAMERLFREKITRTCAYDCSYTNDKSQLNSSNVIVFNTYTTWDVLPKYRSPEQAWLLYAMEPPHRVPKPREWFNSLRFNWTLSYRFDADIVHRHSFQVVRLQPNATTSSTVVPPKPKKVAWIVSNCKTFSQREDYVKALRRTIQVDVFGKCGRLKCKSKRFRCYQDIGKDYYFYLAFENSICKDYSTEKLFYPLMNGMIPVVMGGVNYSRLAPPGSFINFDLFRGPDDLGRYLNSLIEHPEALKPFYEWKAHFGFVHPHLSCTLCEGAHRLLKQKPKFYDNIFDYLRKDVGCMSWKRKLELKYGT